jgi:hypothetical protein
LTLSLRNSTVAGSNCSIVRSDVSIRGTQGTSHLQRLCNRRITAHFRLQSSIGSVEPTIYIKQASQVLNLSAMAIVFTDSVRLHFGLRASPASVHVLKQQFLRKHATGGIDCQVKTLVFLPAT